MTDPVLQLDYVVVRAGRMPGDVFVADFDALAKAAGAGR